MAEAGTSNSTDEDEVVEFSKDQRPAEPGDPVCVVCGRYGAYICDTTDQDVCSVQCKQAHLSSVQEISTNTSETQLPENSSILLFEHLISDKLLVNVQALCCSNSPSPLQAQVISAVYSGNDVKVCSSSCRDRTLSYLIPVVKVIHDNNTCVQDDDDECSYPNMLIITPSRHCCVQLEELTKELIAGIPNMRTALLVGGAPLANQIYRLKSGIQIVIATTERLLDILTDHSTGIGAALELPRSPWMCCCLLGSCIDFSALSILVVEELDVLLGAGLQDQLLSIIGVLPEGRQTIMMCSSSSVSVDKFTDKVTNKLLTISHGKLNTTKASQLVHTIWWVEEGAKKNKLLSLLADDNYYMPPLIVYVNSKMGSVLLAEAIHKQLGVSVLSLHGNMNAEKRDAVVKDFTSGKVQVLVTSVMLTLLRDSLQCQQVIMFDLPQSMDCFSELVNLIMPHSTKAGHVMLFINKSNHLLFAQLVTYMKPLGVRLPTQLMASLPKSSHGNKRQSSSSYPSSRKQKKNTIDLTNQDNLMSFIRKNRV